MIYSFQMLLEFWEIHFVIENSVTSDGLSYVQISIINGKIQSYEVQHLFL